MKEKKLMKLMIFDLDGTLLDKKTHTLSQEVVDAIASAQKKGIKVLLATGRHIETIDLFILNAIAFDGYVTVNGNILLDKNKNKIVDYPLSKEDFTQLTHLCNQHNLPFAFHTRQGIVSEKDNPITQAIETIHHHKDGIIIDENMHDYADAVYNFMIYSEDKEALQVFNDHFKHLKTETFFPHCYDLYNKSINKAVGIDLFLHKFKCTWNDVVAFGDSINDVSMLEKANIAYIIDNNKNTLDHLNIPMIKGGPLSSEFPQIIQKHSKIAINDLTSDEVLIRMNDNRLKMTLLIAASFFIFGIQSMFIAQNDRWILYFSLSVIMSVLAALIMRKKKQ